MTAIYSSTALATKQREVKDAARKGLVHITENGNGAFVFTSEEQYEQTIRREREDAAYEARMEYVLERSDREFAEGRFYEGIDALREAVMRGREARG